ncbi:MAG: hypothetical protein ACRD0C_16695 [Acidimicrobiia bacterium]
MACPPGLARGRFVLVVLLFLASLTACRSGGQADWSWAPGPRADGNLSALAETRGQQFLLHTQGGDVRFLPGVNLGATTPGHSPGELAITAGRYRNWFKEMDRLGVRAVRVYTIHPPAFYEELVAYNRSHRRTPLYLVQGVYLPSEAYLTDYDLFGVATHDAFRAELADAVSAVHGTLRRDPRPGRASGRWTADVGPWVAAWIIGVEWEPSATKASDERNQDRPGWNGRFFSSGPEASPTERWLAEMLDRLAELEAGHGRTMPLAFVNWPTTDPLHHPQEPLPEEDLVGVDANHVAVHPAWPGGYFASYHAYPYYPDFQRHEAAITSFRRDGKPDNYAGYLHLLQQHHAGMPVLVTEYGVPSALGTAHLGPLGRGQGDHSEQEALRIDADLLRVIREAGFGGAFVFEWADEWFKATWNTIDLQLPADRRNLWHDPLTNEQHFGLYATEAGTRDVAVLGGSPAQWDANGSRVVATGKGAVREVRTVHDESYLYLWVRLREASVEDGPLAIGLDVVPGGNGGLPDRPGVDPDADYAVTVSGGAAGQATAWVRASNDPYTLVYGAARGYFPVDPRSIEPGSGAWNPYRLIINRPLTNPQSGERYPVEAFEAGRLRAGTSDPAKPGFDSRATWYARGTDLEIRLPWMMAGLSDPSSRQGLVVGPDGELSTAPVPAVGITVATGGEQLAGRYSWAPWDAPTFHERPKAGLETFAAELRRSAP